MNRLQTAEKPTLYFFGVSTAASSMMRIFPAWCERLGIDAQLLGLDFELHDQPARYREAVRFIKSDPLSLGALVTTHKIDVMHAAGDLFDECDEHATALDEVSCISKSAGRLQAAAVDAVTGGNALDCFLPPDYWSWSRGEVLLLGSGGAAAALSRYLLHPLRGENRPARLTVTDIDPPRLEHLRGRLELLQSPVPVRYCPVRILDTADKLLAELPPGSLVINATGMGKDRPGSPLGDHARWPQNAYAWELNYRGERQFLEQAIAADGVYVEDGWRYFLLGWMDVMARVFHREIPASPAEFEALAGIAEAVRNP